MSYRPTPSETNGEANMSGVIYIQDMRFLGSLYNLKLSKQIINHLEDEGRYRITSLFESSSLLIMYKQYAVIDYVNKEWHHLYTDNSNKLINER